MDTAAAERGFEIRLVKSPGYKKNVSIRRWADDLFLAFALYRAMCRTGSRPDVIVCAYPLIFVSFAVVLFRIRHGGRLLLDVRDMWPEIFSAGRTGLSSLIYRLFAAIHRPFVHVIFRHADGITGITDPFLDWGLSLAGRARSHLDGVFPLTSSPAIVSEAEKSQAREFFRQLGVTEDTQNFCYIGSVSSTVDLETVVEAGRLLQGRRNVKLVLCGSGDQYEQLKNSARGLDTVVLPGFVDGSKIRTLMEMSVAGLAPYRNRRDFLASVPNKVIEYFSCGLPVVAGIEGLVGQLVDSCGCGVKYSEGDSEALARVIGDLVDDPAERERLSRHAADLYAERFSADVVYGRFAQHVEYAARATT